MELKVPAGQSVAEPPLQNEPVGHKVVLLYVHKYPPAQGEGEGKGEGEQVLEPVNDEVGDEVAVRVEDWEHDGKLVGKIWCTR